MTITAKMPVNQVSQRTPEARAHRKKMTEVPTCIDGMAEIPEIVPWLDT